MSNKPISEVIEKIKSAAGKATPGQWKAFCKTHRKGGTFALHTPDDERCGNIVNWQGFDGNDQPKYRNAANVKYMALANPENVVRLIDHIEALEQQLAAERARVVKLPPLPNRATGSDPYSLVRNDVLDVITHDLRAAGVLVEGAE
ncbi:hypothetical protein PEC106568_07490 [Pectobacterium carotovorum subsp. carotovorum]|nr:hypothetical protein PEC106568_07490 [Pectobacterium carotovorum subsp. carotovorum]